MLTAVLCSPSMATLRETLAGLDTALYQGVELRLDYCLDLDVDSLPASPLPTIMTLRSQKQGGHFGGSEKERLHLLGRLLKRKPDYLDIEDDIPPEILNTLHTQAQGTTLLLSHHDFQKTPDLPQLLAGMETLLPPRKGVLYKIACHADSTLDALRMLLFCQQHHPRLRAENSGLVGISMGKHGETTRILAPVVHHGIIYCPVTTATAPGQLDAHTLVKLYNARELNNNTAIYGLIGDPVEQSQGHIFHNSHNKKDELNAVYVKWQTPLEDLAATLHSLAALHVQGLSVTMPLKNAVRDFCTPVPASLHRPPSPAPENKEPSSSYLPSGCLPSGCLPSGCLVPDTSLPITLHESSTSSGAASFIIPSHTPCSPGSSSAFAPYSYDAINTLRLVPESGNQGDRIPAAPALSAPVSHNPDSSVPALFTTGPSTPVSAVSTQLVDTLSASPQTAKLQAAKLSPYAAGAMPDCEPPRMAGGTSALPDTLNKASATSLTPQGTQVPPTRPFPEAIPSCQTHTENVRWEGTNTDGAGALRSLPFPLTGKTAIILGAGGAASALVAAIHEAGGHCLIYNRSPKNLPYNHLTHDIKGLFAPSLPSHDLIINTLPFTLDFPFEHIPFVAGTLAFDISYAHDSAFLAIAAQHGCHTVTGQGMFEEQALLQREFWGLTAT